MMQGPEGLPHIGGFLAAAFTNMHPQEAQVILSAVFVNMVGNIPDEQWELIKEASTLPCECGDPQCGEAIKAVIKAGDECRAHFKRVIDRQRPENPEEKGLAE